MDREDLVQQQDQQHRPRPPENQVAPHHQPPPPPKCPRCDSANTKFCYYNNYSLSQPRYFCKACRRYWTQGGTLRTVPIGGGCRKAKRPRLPSSSSSSALSNGLIPRPQGFSAAAAWSQNVVSGQPSRPAPPMVQPTGGSFYADGPYLPSLAAMQSLPTGGVNHEAAVMGGGRFGSNMALLQGMSFPSVKPPAPPRQQFLPPTRFFPPHQSLVQPGRFNSWTQNVLNAGATSSSAAATSGLWSSSGATGSDQAGPSFTPNQWSDFNPGFNPSQRD